MHFHVHIKLPWSLLANAMHPSALFWRVLTSLTVSITPDSESIWQMWIIYALIQWFKHRGWKELSYVVKQDLILWKAQFNLLSRINPRYLILVDSNSFEWCNFRVTYSLLLWLGGRNTINSVFPVLRDKQFWFVNSIPCFLYIALILHKIKGIVICFASSV